MSNESSFVFTGMRQYVLGADILEHVCSHLYPEGGIQGFDFWVKNPCTTDSCCIKDKVACTEEEQSTALASFSDAKYNVFILPSGCAVSQSMPCTERELAKSFTYTGNATKPSVHVAHVPPAISLFRLYVAAFKYLLNTQVVENPQSYLFARLKMQTIAMEPFSIQYVRLVAKQFFEGCITSNGELLGTIYFGKNV